MPPKVKAKTENDDDGQWRSRFPLARIKKIMQADDDVGKVAQLVPVILSKGLELFMASLVQKATEVTIQTSHKRVLPGHLKLAISQNSVFDFLEPNVEHIPIPQQIEAKQQNEDKKPRKPRLRKSEANDTAETRLNATTEFTTARKRVKLDIEPADQSITHDKPTTPKPDAYAARSMSIASLMTHDDEPVKLSTHTTADSAN